MRKYLPLLFLFLLSVRLMIPYSIFADGVVVAMFLVVALGLSTTKGINMTDPTPDLSLIESPILLEELMKRYDAALFSGVQFTSEEKFNIERARKGTPLTLIGLCETHAIEIQQEMQPLGARKWTAEG